MKKIIRTISIDDDLWYSFQKYALENKTSVSSLIEEYIKETLYNKKNK